MEPEPTQLIHGDGPTMVGEAGAVLVIDDVPDHLEVLRVALTEWDYEVLTAATVEEGLTKAALHRPNVIIVAVDLDQPPNPPWKISQGRRDVKGTRRNPIIIRFTLGRALTSAHLSVQKNIQRNQESGAKRCGQVQHRT